MNVTPPDLKAGSVLDHTLGRMVVITPGVVASLTHNPCHSFHAAASFDLVSPMHGELQCALVPSSFLCTKNRSTDVSSQPVICPKKLRIRDWTMEERRKLT